MKRIVLTLMSVSLILGGCATASKDVSTSYVSPMQYQTYDCDQISSESQRVQSRVSQLGGRLDQAASNDQAIGVAGAILFWPALFFLGGTKAQEAEYGRLKGEYDGLQQASIAKKCSGLVAQSSPSSTTTSNTVATTADVEKRLELLNDLRSKGILSEDEYKAKRTQLLDAALTSTLQFSTPTTQSGTKKTEQDASSSSTVVANIGLVTGDRLTFEDSDSTSGVVTGSTTLVLDNVSVDRLSFNEGKIVTARNGTPIKGQTSAGFVYGHNRDGSSSTGKFRVPDISSDQNMNLTFAGSDTIKVANREIRIVRYKIDGYASSKGANGAFVNGLATGSRVSGEMLVDSSSGMIVKLSTKSAYPNYQISRNLVDISK